MRRGQHFQEYKMEGKIIYLKTDQYFWIQILLEIDIELILSSNYERVEIMFEFTIQQFKWFFFHILFLSQLQGSFIVFCLCFPSILISLMGYTYKRGEGASRNCNHLATNQTLCQLGGHYLYGYPRMYKDDGICGLICYK